MTKIKELEYSEVDEILEKIYSLILWNDDINTFEHVIDCLIKYCEHEKEQAEQCAYLIHFKGKCDVKKGSKEKIKKIYNILNSCGLTATIEII